MQPLDAVQQACKHMLVLIFMMRHQLLGGGCQTSTRKDSSLVERRVMGVIQRSASNKQTSIFRCLWHSGSSVERHAAETHYRPSAQQHNQAWVTA